MGKYTIDDFEVGEKVYHLSNNKLTMIVVEIDKDENDISCRWMDTKGETHSEEFIAEELGKVSDLKPGGMFMK